ncbi:MAG: hypothetical protein ACYSYW_03785 [Planctomycetota bacterium]|jgi:hypothetical protein
MTQIGRCVEKKILPLVMMVFIVILVNYQASIASPDDPCTSERDRYLLLDTRIIESTENAKLTIGKVQKHKSIKTIHSSKKISRGKSGSTISTPTLSTTSRRISTSAGIAPLSLTIPQRG